MYPPSVTYTPRATRTRAQHIHTNTHERCPAAVAAAAVAALLWIPPSEQPQYCCLCSHTRTHTHSLTHTSSSEATITRSTRLAALSADQFVADLHQFLVLLALLVQLILHGRSRDLLALQVQPQLGVVRVMRARHHVQLVVGTGKRTMNSYVDEKIVVSFRRQTNTYISSWEMACCFIIS